LVPAIEKKIRSPGRSSLAVTGRIVANWLREPLGMPILIWA
jgi:hypothetical protein